MLKHSGFLLIVFFAFCQNVFCQKSKDEKKGESSHNKFSHEKKNTKFGVASFYANKFNGLETANGETYQRDKFTAACNQIPFNTWIKVTYLKNGRSVIVKINDRLNCHNKRLVDLSRAAAQKLGIIAHGIARVKVEVLDHYIASN